MNNKNTEIIVTKVKHSKNKQINNVENNNIDDTKLNKDLLIELQKNIN